MTGFGRGAAVEDGVEIVVELISVNRRNIDINISLPRDWQELESWLAERVRKKISRGRINLSVQCKPEAESGKLSWSEKAVTGTLEELSHLAHARGIPFHPDLPLLFQIAAFHRQPAEPTSVAIVKPLLEKALEEALRQLLEMRRKEGKALLLDLANRTRLLVSAVTSIQRKAGAVVPSYRENLLRRLKNAGLELDLEDERVLKEIAIFADRCDISEEIIRLQSHLHQFQQVSEKESPAGRKLEFILQEVNREFNTIGSKANNLAISRDVIDAKNETERIREQLQNIE